MKKMIIAATAFILSIAPAFAESKRLQGNGSVMQTAGDADWMERIALTSNEEKQILSDSNSNPSTPRNSASAALAKTASKTNSVAAPKLTAPVATKVNPIYDDAVINKIVDSKEIGYARVFVNGKLTLTSLRECALARTSIATESTDTDVLTIMLSGKPLANNYGINALGKPFGKKTLWDGPIFFDPSGPVEGFKVDGGYGYKYCTGVCEKGQEGYSVKLVIAGKTKIDLTLTNYKSSGAVTEKNVSCVMGEAAEEIKADIHEAMQQSF